MFPASIPLKSAFTQITYGHVHKTPVAKRLSAMGRQVERRRQLFKLAKTTKGPF